MLQSLLYNKHFVNLVKISGEISGGQQRTWEEKITGTKYPEVENALFSKLKNMRSNKIPMWEE